MNGKTDHFASHIEDVDARDASEHLDEGHGAYEGETFDQGHVAAPAKKRIPAPLLIAGGVVVFIAVGMTVQHFKSAPQDSYAPASTQPAPAAMIPPSPAAPALAQAQVSPPPLPANVPASVGAGIPPSQQSDLPAAGATMPQYAAVDRGNGDAGSGPGATGTTNAANQSSASVGALSAIQNAGDYASKASKATTLAEGATATQSQSSGAAPAASAPQLTEDPKDVEIAQLKAQVASLQAAGQARDHSRHDAHGAHRAHASRGAAIRVTDTATTASDTATDDGEGHDAAKHPIKLATRGHHSRPFSGRHRTEVSNQASADIASLHIKQVVPGQGWVEDERTGKQRVLAVGDRIDNARVTKIDADGYKIVTTAGVIE